MSYVVTQQPDALSLTSTIKDVILTTTDVTDIELKINGTSVLTESYTPDSDNKIYIRELGKLIAGYLAGSGGDVTQAGLAKSVAILATQGATTTTIGTYNVMLCKAYTDVSAVDFFDGNVFMHIMKQKKWVATNSKEYLSAYLDSNHKIQVFVTTSDFENSAKKDFYTTTDDAIKTVDVSFPIVAALFPEIDPDTIIAYRMVLPSEISVYMIDRKSYLFPLQFRYLNYFDVPETIITRGIVSRKGNTTFDNSKIGGVYKKFNVKRADTFTVNSGIIYSFNEYDRYRELFNSDAVEVYFNGKWRKIVISDESSEVIQRLSSLEPVSFTFYFADNMDNNIITGESFLRWILENGEWTDNNMWVDPGHWIDN